MPQIDFDGANSLVKTDKIQGQSGTTVTVPTSHTLAITDAGRLTIAGTAVSGSLGANSHSKVIATTYDLSTASGNKDITGFGYDPKVIIAFWSESSSVNWGWGFMQITQNVGYNIRNIGASTTGVVDQEGGLLAHKTNSSGSVGQVGSMSSISDGVRIAFTKTGSPTGTLYIKLIGFL